MCGFPQYRFPWSVNTIDSTLEDEMDNTIKTWPGNSFGMFRWTFFLAGLLFSIVWIFGEPHNEGGAIVTETERWLTVLFFFPVFWGFGFIPNSRCEWVTVDQSEVIAVRSTSKTIFHRKVFTEFSVPAKDVERVEISPFEESNDVSISIRYRRGNSELGWITLEQYPDGAAARKLADDAARILNCKVKRLEVSEAAQAV
jgi:hypothetical protein